MSSTLRMLFRDPIYMYLSALNFNNYGPAIPDHVHEYYSFVSPKTYRAYFLLNRNCEIPQYVTENVYYE